MCFDRLLLSVYFLPQVAHVVVARSVRSLSSFFASDCDLRPGVASAVSGTVAPRDPRRVVVVVVAVVGAERGVPEHDPASTGCDPVGYAAAAEPVAVTG